MENNQYVAAYINAASAAYDSFIYHVSDSEMSGAEKRKAIWQDVKMAFIGSIADMLKKYITTKMTELLVDTSTESAKTSAHATGAAKRIAIDQAEIASSASKTAANTTEAASGFFKAHSSIPYVGYAIAAAFVVAMMAMLGSVGRKNKGGIVRDDELFKGFVPEGEDGLIGVQAGERVMSKKATARYAPQLEAMERGSASALKLPQGYNISTIPAPQPVTSSNRFESYREVIERSVPVEGKIIVQTVAPDYAHVKEYHIKVNREINRPDNKYVDKNLETEDEPYN